VASPSPAFNRVRVGYFYSVNFAATPIPVLSDAADLNVCPGHIDPFHAGLSPLLPVSTIIMDVGFLVNDVKRFRSSLKTSRSRLINQLSYHLLVFRFTL